MDIIVRGALWGAVVSAPFGVAIGYFGYFLQGPDNNVSMRDGVIGFAIAAAVIGAAIGAGIGAIIGVLNRSARKRNAPIVQYDAPQEGVWPPPPIVPGDNEKGNNI